MHYCLNYAMETVDYIRLDCGTQQALAYKHQLDLDGLILNQYFIWRTQNPVYE